MCIQKVVMCRISRKISTKIWKQKLFALCSLILSREEESKNQTEIQHLRMKMYLSTENTVRYDENTDISKPAESGKEGPEGETTWPH